MKREPFVIDHDTFRSKAQRDDYATGVHPIARRYVTGQKTDTERTMKPNCTNTALSYIQLLKTEMHHLEASGMEKYTAIGIRFYLDGMDRTIRREYARLHPDETLPQTAGLPCPHEDS